MRDVNAMTSLLLMYKLFQSDSYNITRKVYVLICLPELSIRQRNQIKQTHILYYIYLVAFFVKIIIQSDHISPCVCRHNNVESYTQYTSIQGIQRIIRLFIYFIVWPILGHISNFDGKGSSVL